MFGLNKKLKQQQQQQDQQKKKKLAASSKRPREDGPKLTFIGAGDAARSKKAAPIPDLICKSYVDGCLVLGCVHDIRSGELVVSLPGLGNFGYVKLNNISSAYAQQLLRSDKSDKEEEPRRTLLDMYTKGELLRCKVVAYVDKRLQLTIDPKEVNANLTYKSLADEMVVSGAVKLKEDHGYTIDLGIGDLTAFYRTDAAAAPLAIGQTCLFRVASKASKRTISVVPLLAGNSSSSINQFYELQTKNNFDAYLPGAQLSACAIDKISRNGLQVSVGGGGQLSAYVHASHIPVAKRNNLVVKESSGKAAYETGEHITGTIIFVNPYAKCIYLSLLPHLVDSQKRARTTQLFGAEGSRSSTEPQLTIGQVVEEAHVCAHSFKGLYVRFKCAGDKALTGFVPKRHLVDQKLDKDDDKNKKKNNNHDDDDDDDDNDDNGDEDKKKQRASKRDLKNMTREDIERAYPLQSAVRARIFDYSLLEDVVLLSMRASVLNARYMTYDELHVGQVVRARVRSLHASNGGVSVTLSEFVAGFVPHIHTGDVPLSDAMRARKFPLGAEVRLRVVQLCAPEKRCVLSAKKTLVTSKLPLISSMGQLRLGLETYGVVVSVQKYGLLVSLLNDLKGLLPRSQLGAGAQQLSDLKQAYRVGQLIKCSVLDFDREKEQIKLSVIMESSVDHGDDVNGETSVVDKKAVAAKGAHNKQSTATSAEESGAEYQVGERISGFATVMQVNEEACYFRLKLPRGTRNGIIYKSQLSDLDFLNDALFELYKRTRRVSNLMITQTPEVAVASVVDTSGAVATSGNKAKSCHYLTRKTTLLSQRGIIDNNNNNNINNDDQQQQEQQEQQEKQQSDTAAVLEFDQLKTGQWQRGWVRKVLASGVLVELLGRNSSGLVGFCANKHVGAYASHLRRLSHLSGGLASGQSVLVRVSKLIAERRQFVATVRTRYDLAQRCAAEQRYMLDLFRSYLASVQQLLPAGEADVSSAFLSASFADKNSKNINSSSSSSSSVLQTYERAAHIRVGSNVRVAVRSFNSASGQIECVFMSELEQEGADHQSASLSIGYAFVNGDDTAAAGVDDPAVASMLQAAAAAAFAPGTQLDALVLAFDPLARAFLLTVDKRAARLYARNFDAQSRAHLACRAGQSIKAELLCATRWFAVVGLKAHALGRLAIMPLFRNDFTPMHTFEAARVADEAKSRNSSQQQQLWDLLDGKVKQQQVLNVSAANVSSLGAAAQSAAEEEKRNSDHKSDANKSRTKEEKRFVLYYVGQTLKVLVKSDENDTDTGPYLLVVNDLAANGKSTKKQLLRQLALLNETTTAATSELDTAVGEKRKSADDNDEPVLVRRKPVAAAVTAGLDKKKATKRKATDPAAAATTTAEATSNDSIEVVASVVKKRSKPSGDISNSGGGGGSGSGGDAAFPWAVTDFDQFNEAVNKEAADETAKTAKTLLTNEAATTSRQQTTNVVEDRAADASSATAAATTIDELESAVAANPNSAAHWLAYVDFHLRMAEVERARATANRALRTIFYRDDSEKLTVWVALLALECEHGNQATLDDAFNRANQTCDSYKIHCHMADIYVRFKRIEDAESVYIKMIRKFSKSTDAWIRYGIFHYKNSNCELARKLLIKSFNSLDKADHVEMVNKFAQLEFKYGDVERGKTMYDSLLFTYPNRTDIWSVYLDMLIKQQLHDEARHIFARIIELGLTVKRMKFIFKKYIEFERQHGSAALLDRVRQLAVKYVERNDLSDAIGADAKSSVTASVQDTLRKNLKV